MKEEGKEEEENVLGYAHRSTLVFELRLAPGVPSAATTTLQATAHLRKLIEQCVVPFSQFIFDTSCQVRCSCYAPGASVDVGTCDAGCVRIR